MVDDVLIEESPLRKAAATTRGWGSRQMDLRCFEIEERRLEAIVTK